jgi:DNA polymerase II small subunit/DNA polymerase delta subunit B
MHLKTLHCIIGLGFATGVVSGAAPKGQWDAFNFAPSSKTVYPTAIHSTNGSVTKADLLVNNKGAATLSGNGSWVALDFGVEVRSVLTNSLMI